LSQEVKAFLFLESLFVVRTLSLSLIVIFLSFASTQNWWWQ